MLEFLPESIIFAQGQPAAGQGQGSLFQLVLPFILILPLFYFMLIRPNQKREKERKSISLHVGSVRGG